MATSPATAAGEIVERGHVADGGSQCRKSDLGRRGLLDSDLTFPLKLTCGLNRLAALHRNIH